MRREQWEEIKYFKYTEFNSPDNNRSGLLMDYDFVKLLDKIRGIYGHPIIINSGFRTKEHNQKLIDIGMKASPNSSHIKGIAADIKCTDSISRGALLDILFSLGVKRIGIAQRFIHLDIDKNKINAVWLYNH